MFLLFQLKKLHRFLNKSFSFLIFCDKDNIKTCAKIPSFLIFHLIVLGAGNKEYMMIKRSIVLPILFFMGIFMINCGLPDEPITSPHAISIVRPQGDNGPTFLFASNRFLDKVFRINLENLSVKEIDTGEKPRNIASNDQGTLVAVANEKGHSVTIIDTMTLAKATVWTGYQPTDLRFSPDSKWIAVANYLDQTVSLINLSTYAAKDIWVGGGPTSVAFDDTGSKLAVACYKSYSVAVINMETHAVEASWVWDDYWHHHGSQYDREHPQVVLFGKDGTSGENLLFVGHKEGPDYWDHSWEYYPDDYNGVLSILTLADDWRQNVTVNPLIDMIVVGANPRGLIWDKTGESLITINHNFIDSSQDSLSVVDFDEEGDPYQSRQWVIGGNPVAAAISPTENIVAAACKNSGAVALVDLDFESRKLIGTADKPYALAFNQSGTKIVVVHESPLMPISIVDVRRGTSEVVKNSTSMDRWFE